MLGVVADRPVASVPANLRRLIQSSLGPMTPERHDSHGLSYPGVAPLFVPGCRISGIEVVSTYCFQRRRSGYQIELGVSRSWAGRDTRAAERSSTRVAMSHAAWDMQTQAIGWWDKRPWGTDAGDICRSFFPNGLAEFLEEVGWVRGLVGRAIKSVQSSQM